MLAAALALVASAVPGSTPASASTVHHRGLGLAPPTSTHHAAQSAQQVARSVAALDVLPSSVDLTGNAPAPGDQGAVNSCVSWAIDYTAMGYYLSRDHIGGAPLAPMYTYSQLVHGRNVGTGFGETFAIADSQGVDAHSDYTQGDYDYTHTPNAREIANASSWVISAYHTLDVGGSHSVTQAAIKGALASGKPVVVGMPVYEGFFYLAPGHSDWTGTTGTLEGYHAVTALGYDRYGITIENSWSASWGNAGFARLSWSFVDDNVFAAYSVNEVVSHSTVPRVTAVRTAIGPSKGGRRVTLTGANFAADAKVKFGGALGTHETVDGTHTHITVVVPRHSRGLVPVVVTGSSGTSQVAPRATYRYETGPTFRSVSSRKGSTAGRSRVVITGTNLFGAHVYFGKTMAHASLNGTGTLLRVAVPAHRAGVVTISVTTPVGTVRGLSFRYRSPGTHG